MTQIYNRSSSAFEKPTKAADSLTPWSIPKLDKQDLSKRMSLSAGATFKSSSYMMPDW
jgi:hypothetical protein